MIPEVLDQATQLYFKYDSPRQKPLGGPGGPPKKRRGAVVVFVKCQATKVVMEKHGRNYQFWWLTIKNDGLRT